MRIPKVFASVGVMVILGVGRVIGSQSPSIDMDQSMNAVPPDLPGCEIAEWSPSWEPKFINADNRILVTYDCGAYALHFAAGQYMTQGDGKEAVSELNEFAPSWVRARLVAGGRVRAGDGRLQAMEFFRQDARHWIWFAVGDRAHSNGVAAKIDEILGAMALTRQPAAMFTLAAEGRFEDDLFERTGAVFWNWYVRQVVRR